MKRTLMGLLIVALLVGAVSADPFIGNTLRYSIDVKDGCDITALGDTDVDFGTGDITTTGAASVGTMTSSGDGSMAGLVATGDIILSGISAESAPVSFITATYTSTMAGENNDIVFTAVPDASWGGALGNSIDIILVDPGEDTGACSVDANTSTGDVSVTLSYGTGAINATAAAVIAAITADETASGMVTCANASANTGAGTVTALSSQDLSGGVNGTAGTTGQLLYYSGDLFHLVSGSEIYDATWAQWDGGDTDGSVSSTRSITTTGTMTAEQLTSTDDGAIAGLLTVGETLGVSGEATFGASVVFTPVTKTADYTILDNDAFAFSVGNASGHQTLTLPTVADNAGRFILVSITTDPGDNNVVIDGEGSETVGGATTKTCTDAVGSFYFIYSDGVAWRLVSSLGTWS